jgi:TonB-dependent SusC/RagA subfamily outer membrane receptor
VVEDLNYKEVHRHQIVPSILTLKTSKVVVLKDAASTVLYGSRGASGVILITTKKGKKGEKSSITFNSSFNVGTVNRLPIIKMNMF